MYLPAGNSITPPVLKRTKKFRYNGTLMSLPPSLRHLVLASSTPAKSTSYKKAKSKSLSTRSRPKPYGGRRIRRTRNKRKHRGTRRR